MESFRAYLLGDSSFWHAGSAFTTQVIRELCPEIIGTLDAREPTPDLKTWEACNVVICNGEGTMHHGGGGHAMKLLRRARWEGKRTALINTVWQDQPGLLNDALSGVDYVSARDPWSQAEILQHRDQCDLYADLTMNYGPVEGTHDCGVLWGARGVDRKNPDLWTHDKSKHPSWRKWVEHVATGTVYVTGEYHGMIAAILAGTPVVCQRSNSWKMEALSEWLGDMIPILDTEDEINAHVREGGDGGVIAQDLAHDLPKMEREDLLSGVYSDLNHD